MLVSVLCVPMCAEYVCTSVFVYICVYAVFACVCVSISHLNGAEAAQELEGRRPQRRVGVPALGDQLSERAGTVIGELCDQG